MRELKPLSAVAAVMVLGASAQAQTAPRHGSADLVLVNAKVITVDAKERIAHSVAVLGNRIVAVDGTDEWVGPTTRVIDLKGRTLLPGFIDAHSHVEGMADVQAHTIDIQAPPLKDGKAIIARLKEAQKALPPRAWLRGNGTYNQVMPTREELDEAFPDNPVRLDWSAHDNLINHAAAVALKLDRTFPDPPKGSTGRLERNKDGEVTIIRDYKVDFPVDAFPYAEKKEALRKVLRDFYLHRGVTTVSDLSTADAYRAYQDLKDAGQLPTRVRMNPFIRQPAQLDALLTTGMRTGLGDDMLMVGAVKIILDGVWGTTAAVYKPFWNGSGTTFIPNNIGGTSRSQEQLTREIVAAHGAGWQVEIHANGDRAQDMTLNAYEAAQKAYPRPDARDRIEHFAHFLVQDEARTEERLRRMVADRIIPSAQVAFLWRLTDTNIREPGIQFFALRRLIDLGLHPTGGVDNIGTQPFATYPMFSIQRAVARDTKYGRIVQPEQAITVMEAIKMFTIWAAEANFLEKSLGSIEIGKIADFVVLGGDPLTTPKTKLSEIPVEMTILDGKIQYDRAEAAR
ncbi:amidohydrolase [Sphingobium ummariense]